MSLLRFSARAIVRQFLFVTKVASLVHLHTSEIWFKPLDEALVLVGDPSWEGSLASEKLARRPSMLPLPFL